MSPPISFCARGRYGRHAAAVLALCLATLAGGCTKTPEQVEASAAAHLAKNESRSAMVELKDLLQREPNRARARLLLGRSLNDQFDYAGAESELRRAAKLGVDVNELAAPLARAMLLQGQFEALTKESLFNRTTAPDAVAAVLDFKANALLALSRPDEAVALLERARTLAPSSGAVNATLATVLLSRGDLEGARRMLLAAEKADPRSAEVQRSLGLLMLQTGKLADAAIYFAKAAALAVGPPRDRELQRISLAALVDTELRQQRVPAAQVALERLDGLGDGRINGLLRTRLNIAKGDLPLARREAEKLLARGRADPDAALLLGLIYAMQGNDGQAEMQFKTVLAAEPENNLARRVLAQLRMQQGKPREAAAMLQPLLKEASGNVVTLAVQANLAAGDRKAALALLEQRAGQGAGDAHAVAELARGFLLADAPDQALAALPPTDSFAEGDVAELEGLRLSALLAKNDLPAARKTADALAVRNPLNVRLQVMLGDFYVRAGASDLARAALERAAAARPQDPAIELRLAQLDALAGDLRKAEARLVAAAEKNPRAAVLQSAIAELRAAQGNSKAALEALSKAQSLAPDDTGLRLREAQVRLASGDKEGARRVTEAAAKRAPSDKSIVRARVATLEQLADAAGAIKVASDALEASPKDPELSLLLAGTQAKAGQLDAAIATLRAAGRAQPRSIPLMAALGELQLRKGDLKEARRVSQEIEGVEPDHPMATLLEAEIAVREKRFAAAADGIATANVRAQSTALVLREFSVRREAKLPDPEITLTRWLKAHPNDTPVILALAEVRLGERQIPEALRLYEGVLARDGNNAIALNNAAWAHGTLGDLKTAVSLASRAYSLAPQASAVADTYGWALTRNGEHVKALEILSNARKRAGAIPDLDLHYAAALVGLARRDEARTVLDELLSKHPKFQSRGEAETLRASLD